MGLLPVAVGCGASSGATAGVGGSASPTPSSHHLVVTAGDDFRFTPAALEAESGPVTIELRDDGSYPHNISFPALHATSKTVTGSLGEQTTTLQLNVPKPGTYRFICTYHSKAGMTGTLTVH